MKTKNNPVVEQLNKLKQPDLGHEELIIEIKRAEAMIRIAKGVVKGLEINDKAKETA